MPFLFPFKGEEAIVLKIAQCSDDLGEREISLASQNRLPGAADAE